MTPDDVKTALISVLKGIQDLSGLDCPELDGTSVPPKILPKFDSTVWPVAATLVARKLDIIIPHNVHIFGGENRSPLLSIDQAASLICKKARPRSQEKAVA